MRRFYSTKVVITKEKAGEIEQSSVPEIKLTMNNGGLKESDSDHTPDLVEIKNPLVHGE